MATNKILIVDDDPAIRWMLVEAVKEWGYQPIEASTCQAALFANETESPAAVLLDIDLPDGSGLETLSDITQRHPEAIVIMVTAKGLFDNAVHALRGGAFDFITKPINLHELEITLRNGLETRKLRKKISILRRQQAHQFDFDQLIGNSPAMKQLVLLARKVAQSEAAAVLLQGESGTGKELVARAIHYGSSRADCPFVPINCAAIPATLIESELFGHEKGSFTDAKALKEGLFEQAEGGTLFLDEIGELELGLQAKLLRVLEEGCFRRVGGLKDVTYDARIIAASNRDLKADTVHFRRDLFYRLSVIQIELPPLREREDDVLVLAAHFIEHFNHHLRKNIAGLTPEVINIFRHYSWPGNVRELRNIIERAMILEDSSLITAQWLPHSMTDFLPHPRAVSAAVETLLPPTIPASLAMTDIKQLFPLPPNGINLEAVEQSLLLQALELTQGNQTKAAELLQISRDQFRYRLKKIEFVHDAHSYQ